MPKGKKKTTKLVSSEFYSVKEIGGEFNHANVSKLKDSIKKYTTLLKNAKAFNTKSNSEEYNLLVEELDNFNDLTDEFLSIPEKELNENYLSKTKEELNDAFLFKHPEIKRIDDLVKDIKDNLEAIRIRAESYSDVKVEQKANDTRTRRIAIADMLTDFVIDLEDRGLNEYNASAVFPLEDQKIINNESEATAKGELEKSCNDFLTYLKDCDTRSPFTLSGNANDVYRKSYLLQTKEKIKKQIETYQAERTRKDSSLVHKNDSVLETAYAQMCFIDAGLELRNAIDKVENPPEGANMSQLENERDKCLLHMSMMMAYAEKTGWGNIKQDIPKKISECSTMQMLNAVKDNALNVMFNDNSLPNVNQKIKAYKDAGIKAGTLPEEIRFTYDGKGFKCSTPTSNLKALQNILGLKNLHP